MKVENQLQDSWLIILMAYTMIISYVINVNVNSFSSFINNPPPTSTTQLNLNFANQNMADSDALQVGNALSTFNKIDTLTIDCSGGNLTGTGAAAFASAIIANPNQIKHLCLIFVKNAIGNSGYGALAEAIRSQTGLLDLTFKIQDNGITSSQTNQLNDSTISLLKSITSVTLDNTSSCDTGQIWDHTTKVCIDQPVAGTVNKLMYIGFGALIAFIICGLPLLYCLLCRRNKQQPQHQQTYYSKGTRQEYEASQENYGSQSDQQYTQNRNYTDNYNNDQYGYSKKKSEYYD